jgi:hypothetical protein
MRSHRRKKEAILCFLCFGEPIASGASQSSYISERYLFLLYGFFLVYPKANPMYSYYYGDWKKYIYMYTCTYTLIECICLCIRIYKCNDMVAHVVMVETMKSKRFGLRRVEDSIIGNTHPPLI